MPVTPRAVVHFEVTGEDAAGLRGYYGRLFGWEFDTSSPVAPEVSAPGEYGFTDPGRTSRGAGIPGGVGGGAGHGPRAVFYVGVPDVGAALEQAEALGGQRVMGPVRAPSGLVVAHFRDPAGNLVGVAAVG
ncbi:glyoxalase [Kineococcus sp. T13]|uniref:VOC family protein n=1 Tax=Kineococcus vitellinus TaxID=2696565 RepID=UPI001412FF6D|nr:VOC family protein [Kineococcus vitellinus]NAZ77096.1 glyoxalase [Kineococcus vitellinus]